MPRKPKAKKITEFKELKLNSTTYAVGDSVRILLTDDSESFGKILRIFRDHSVEDAFLHIGWYYKPLDIFAQVPEFISEAELFYSDLEQDISVRCIYDKINILSFEEYYGVNEVDTDHFFVRAFYKHKKKIIEPPLSQWVRACYCNCIINPDLVYVKCDQCNKDFHVKCTQCFTGNEEKWFCQICKPVIYID